MPFSLSDVSFTAGGKTILSNIGIDVPQGSFLSVLGPSGSGKSSLLKLLNGLESPSRGKILFHDRNIASYDPIRLRKRVGLVFQIPVMVPGTVRENLCLSFRWNRKENQPEEDRLTRILELVGLDPTILDQDARDLSGGEKQRISLGRTLLNKPEVLLLDEPTASLDPGLATRIIRRIATLHHELDLTTILVSHQHRLVREVADACAFLIDHTIVESGPVSILDNPKTEPARTFLWEEEEG